MTSSPGSNSINTVHRCYEVVPEAGYILEPRRAANAGDLPGDLSSQVHAMEHEEKMFNIFYSILLGKDEQDAQSGTGGVSSRSDDGTMEPHGSELDTSTATFWLTAYLKTREKTSGYSADNCLELLQPLKMAYEEVMKFGRKSTDVAKVFAKMDIDHVEFLLKYPENLRSTLRGIVKDRKLKGTGLPDHERMPDFELFSELEKDWPQIED